MFTGIILSTSKITKRDEFINGLRLEVEVPAKELSQYSDVIVGESIAVNGVCLTVETSAKGKFTFFLSHETCKLSNLGKAAAGQLVNLERALKVSDRLSGHIVQGHVDGMAKLLKVMPVGDSHEFEVELPKELSRYVVAKGSITLDGVSLTANTVSGDLIRLMVIPHTLKVTSLAKALPGHHFNVEVDILAKYVEKLTKS